MGITDGHYVPITCTLYVFTVWSSHYAPLRTELRCVADYYRSEQHVLASICCHIYGSSISSEAQTLFLPPPPLERCKIFNPQMYSLCNEWREKLRKVKPWVIIKEHPPPFAYLTYTRFSSLSFYFGK
jgi:hypothetical protein